MRSEKPTPRKSRSRWRWWPSASNPWQLIRLATKAAPSKNAADVAATPYAIVVSMVLDGWTTSGWPCALP